MIRTHEIVTDNLGFRCKNIDELIKEFLSKNKAIELVDIKYQVSTYKAGYDAIHRTSALIIYKEKSDDKQR